MSEKHEVRVGMLFDFALVFAALFSNLEIMWDWPTLFSFCRACHFFELLRGFCIIAFMCIQRNMAKP